jgi:hypothetical protein
MDTTPPRPIRPCTLAAAGAFTAALALTAHAQWTVTNLHPTSTVTATRSRAQGCADAIQAGYAFVGGVDHALTWTGTGASAADRHPAGAQYSRIYSIANFPSPPDAAGVARFNLDHAARWSGPNFTFTDLHPAAGFSSVAYDTDGVQQVGIVYIGIPPAGQYHASVWTGAADSWVSLNPNTPSSFAYGVGSGSQVGYVDVGGFVANAALWRGTPESFVNLHPPAASYSIAFAVKGNPIGPQQQGGVAGIDGVDHASIWAETPESWVDLHPAGAIDSEVSALGPDLGEPLVQVGSALIGTYRHAGYWTGTAASWVDLATFLTGPWGDTEAEDVWISGSQMFIAGWGRNLTTNRDEALLWTGPTPAACDSVDYNGDGIFPDIQDIADFLTCFGGGPCPNSDIDFNSDGLFPDTADIEALLRVFAGGPCL